jgi:AcrR family transcriptional regulator
MGAVATGGLGDRSLRDIAEAAGSSHRMLLYHFGSRQGLVEVIVEAMEASQRQALVELSMSARSPAALTRALWLRLTSREVLPFVRLFLETVALTSRGPTGDLTDPWLEASAGIAREWGTGFDEVEARLCVAVVRGLLVDVVAGGSVEAATDALERHLERLPEAAPVS